MGRFSACFRTGEGLAEVDMLGSRLGVELGLGLGGGGACLSCWSNLIELQETSSFTCLAYDFIPLILEV